MKQNFFIFLLFFKELELPSSLTSIERAYAHKLCKMNDLISNTKGLFNFARQSSTIQMHFKYIYIFILIRKNSKKCLIIAKKNDSDLAPNESHICLSTESKNSLKNFNLTTKDREELISKIQKPTSKKSSFSFHYDTQIL